MHWPQLTGRITTRLLLAMRTLMCPTGWSRHWAACSSSSLDTAAELTKRGMNGTMRQIVVDFVVESGSFVHTLLNEHMVDKKNIVYIELSCKR